MFNYILGTLYIIFGILKFIICFVMLLFKDDTFIKKYKTLRYFTINDFTPATKIYFFIMLIFSIDIFLKGLSKFGLISKKYFNDYLYLVLGLIIIIVYIFVVFFPKNSQIIKRNEKHNDIYKSIYLNTGYIYFIAFLFEIIKKNINDYFLIIISVILIFFNIFIIIKLDFIKTIIETKKEIDMMFMIPLSIF
jgi:hypothetical protein